MSIWTLLGTAVIALAAFVFLRGFVKTFRKYRGKRVITCPENHEPAAVDVAAWDAAKWFAISGQNDVHLSACSRWPEKAGCNQACLREIEGSPASCLVRNIVTAWYEGKHCHFCGRSIGAIVWHERPPALRRPDGSTVEWKDLPPQDLQKTFTTCDPVCWACHVVETFRHEHPQMVIQRARQAVAAHALPPSSAVY